MQQYTDNTTTEIIWKIDSIWMVIGAQLDYSLKPVLEIPDRSVIGALVSACCVASQCVDGTGSSALSERGLAVMVPFGIAASATNKLPSPRIPSLKMQISRLPSWSCWL